MGWILLSRSTTMIDYYTLNKTKSQSNSMQSHAITFCLLDSKYCMHKGYHLLLFSHLGDLDKLQLFCNCIRFSTVMSWNAFVLLTNQITWRCSATSAIKPILIRVIWYFKGSVFQEKIILSTVIYVKFLLFVKQVGPLHFYLCKT